MTEDGSDTCQPWALVRDLLACLLLCIWSLFLFFPFLYNKGTPPEHCRYGFIKSEKPERIKSEKGKDVMQQRFLAALLLVFEGFSKYSVDSTSRVLPLLSTRWGKTEAPSLQSHYCNPADTALQHRGSSAHVIKSIFRLYYLNVILGMENIRCTETKKTNSPLSSEVNGSVP